jgi:hypothetical protein
MGNRPQGKKGSFRNRMKENINQFEMSTFLKQFEKLTGPGLEPETSGLP